MAQQLEETPVETPEPESATSEAAPQPETEPNGAASAKSTGEAEASAAIESAAASEAAPEPRAVAPAERPATAPAAETAARVDAEPGSGPAAVPPAEQAPPVEPPEAVVAADAAAGAHPAEDEVSAGPVAEAMPERPASEQAAEPAEPAAPVVSAAAAAPEAAAPTEPAPETETAPGTPAPAEAESRAAAPTAPPAEPPPPVEEPPEVVALRAAKEARALIEGTVIGWNRGGFHIALGDHGLTAFCPNSEMELGRPKDPAVYIDRTFAFHVLKVQKRGRRVVLSRSEVLAAERAERVAALRGLLAAGTPVAGKVTSLTDFGAFVDLDGAEGLVHVSEISRRRISHAREAVEIGQPVTVKILKIDKAGERVSLSMKALEPDPWQGIEERYKRGGEFTGKVVRKTDFGLFVELEPDVDGLIHLSRLAPGVPADDPSLAIGETVQGWVFETDRKRRRISLSLRQVPAHDPWDGAAKRYADGAVIEGTVESSAPFGVFINLEPGLTGLLPASEMQVPRGANPAKLFAPGQKVPVQVVGVDPRRKRITLAREGSKVEGSRADYQSYVKQQQKPAEGMSAMAAAFAKLKGRDEDESEEG